MSRGTVAAMVFFVGTPFAFSWWISWLSRRWDRDERQWGEREGRPDEE